MELDEDEMRFVLQELDIPGEFAEEIHRVHVVTDSRRETKSAFLINQSLGIVYGYGDNQGGILATGDDQPVDLEPERIHAFDGEKIKTISFGDGYALALTAEGGRVYSWGSRNEYGQLGQGNFEASCEPKVVNFSQPIPYIISVASGRRNAWALSSDSRVFSWGSSQHGALGIDASDSTMNLTVPFQVPLSSDSPFHSIASSSSTVYVWDDGQIISWGENSSGEVGCGSQDCWIATPTVVPWDEAADIESFAVGDGICALLTTEGSLQMWGCFTPKITSPEIVEIPERVIELSSNGGFIVVFVHDGGAYIYEAGSDIDAPHWVASKEEALEYVINSFTTSIALEIKGQRL